MERVALLIMYTMTSCILSYPIDNGFTVKLKSTTIKQESKPKNTGTVYVKPPQDPKLNEDHKIWAVLDKLFYIQSTEPVPGLTNQKANVAPKRSTESKTVDIRAHNRMNYFNLPLIGQPYDDYKLLVATAPPNVNIGSSADNKKMVVLVVFPNDGLNGDDNIEEVPRIFFVNQDSVKRIVPKKEVDPILIIDSNRTVTGLKSKEVPKFVRFKNKFNRFNYHITR